MLLSTPCDAVITNAERARLAKKVRATIEKIGNRGFEIDPLLVEDVSLATSEISSAFKRHGLVLEQAFLTALSTRRDLEVWSDRIRVPIRKKPIQIDLITYRSSTGTLTAYELKRAFENQDAGAQHSIDERLKSLLQMLPNYALIKGLSATNYRVAVVGYYDSSSTKIGAHEVIGKPDLMTEFGACTMDFVEDVNDYFRHCLLRRQTGHLIKGLQQIAALPAFREALPPSAFPSWGGLSSLGAAIHPWDALGRSDTA